MPLVPKRVADLTFEEIFEFGRKGVAEDTVFDWLELNEAQRKSLRQLEKWTKPYRKGAAQRELDIADKVNQTDDTQLMKELLKTTTIPQPKQDEEVIEFIIDAPEWLKANAKRKAIKKNVQTDD